MITKNFLKEVISATKSYLKKEVVRQKIQDLIVAEIKSGKIKDQEQLSDFFDTVLMSINALKMIPFDVFVKLAMATKKKEK